MTSENSLKRSIERGDPVYGAKATTHDPSVIETYGAIGLDYVWIDFEHGGPSPYDSTVVEDLTRTTDAADIEPLVRLPSPDPALVRKVLDGGIRTILIPRIETAAELRGAVEAAYFRYNGTVGERGIGGGRANQWGRTMADHVECADDEVLVGTMIENENVIMNIESILDVPHLGFAFVGPSDLSASLGHPLRKKHPAVLDAIERARDACLDADVPLGCIRNDPTNAATATDEGYRILRIGNDLGAIREVLSKRLDEIRGA